MNNRMYIVYKNKNISQMVVNLITIFCIAIDSPFNNELLPILTNVAYLFVTNRQ